MLVFGVNLWRLYECIRIFFLVSGPYEPDHFCRIDGNCHSSSAFGRFSPAAGTGYDPDDQRSAFVLRHLHAGPIQKHRMKKYYLIFGMCDESFSINYTAASPPDVDRGWFMFWVTLLNHFYWFSGSALGGHSVLLSN